MRKICQRCANTFDGAHNALCCSDCRPIVARERAREQRKLRVEVEFEISVPAFKTCGHCNQTKPASEFSPQKDRPNGLSGTCKACRSEAQRDARAKQPKQPRQPKLNGLLCKICGTELTGAQRHVCRDDECQNEWRRQYSYERSAANDYHRKTPRDCICKECGQSFRPEYGDKKRVFCSDECLKRYTRRVSKATRRARINGASVVENIDPLYILNRDKWRCYLCGVSTPRRLRGSIDDRSPEVDHVVPLARGGNHTEGNLRCCCRKCNQKKADNVIGISVVTSVQPMLL